MPCIEPSFSRCGEVVVVLVLVVVDLCRMLVPG